MRHDRSTPCPICHAEDVRVFRAGCTDRLHETPGSWDVLGCQACGVRFTAPDLSETELLKHYPAEYNVVAPDKGIRGNRAGNVVRQLATLPYRLRYGNPDRLPAPFGNRRALDVGCGTGNYLKRLSARGWEPHGIDFNAEAVHAARSRVPNAIVHHGTLENLPAQKPFAYISLNHVLEHVKEPENALRRCYELLDTGGLLSINVPNIDSIEARVFRARWRGLDIPRHVIHFNKNILTELVTRRGFRVTMLRPALFASSRSAS